jgi:hypothetical protein
MIGPVKHNAGGTPVSHDCHNKQNYLLIMERSAEDTGRIMDVEDYQVDYNGCLS